MALNNIPLQPVTQQELSLLSQVFYVSILNPTTHTLDGKIQQTTQELAKLVQGDPHEPFQGNEKVTYGILKGIVERIANSEKLMKELIVLPMGFGMPPMQFMGAGPQGSFPGQNPY